MTPRVDANSSVCQGNSSGPGDAVPDKALVPTAGDELALLRQDFRDAIEESRVKKESIAAAIGLPDAAYLSKLFSGEKPITGKHIVGLPDDVERIFARKRATRLQLLVVDRVDDATAQRQLAVGLLNLLVPKPQPAQAGLPMRMQKAVLR